MKVADRAGTLYVSKDTYDLLRVGVLRVEHHPRSKVVKGSSRGSTPSHTV
ncbi:hypothetical protein [Humibacillus xanthopallidus]|uniref:Uncharacterized protein n=1 Tax=Humibacillus xanthopallidus TaxID=412689 RepID=A0A543H9Y1_9MICO|nr:hypothetical protein [Humibacillus xanthopallidus]TQM55128.1 hypothetical protein FBY41_4456 [Humibacillus xanthopallidus]